MQRASGDTTRTPIRSTPSSHSAQHRTADSISTRRLSTAIDGLRREGETVLWELNSLMTQNLTLEQRLKLQTEELDHLCRGLVNLRDQHKTMEQQYKEEVRVIKSELEAIREERGASTTGHDRRRFPPQSGSSSHSEGDVQPQYPHNRTSRPYTPLQSTSSSLSYRDDRRSSSYRGTESHSLNTARIETPRDSGSPSPTKPPSSSQMSSAPRSPRGGHPTWPSPHHRPAPEDDATPSGSQHEPSLSPTTTLIGGDIPSRPRSRRIQQ